MNNEEDLITSSVRKVSNYVSFCFICWSISLLSYLAVGLASSNSLQFNFVFFPMIFGTVVTLLLTSNVLYSICRQGLVLIASDQRAALHRRGVHSFESFIEYESLPLMRKLYLWSIVTIIFLAVALSTELSAYISVILGQEISLISLVPFLTCLGFYLVFLVTVKLLSVVNFSVISFVISAIVGYAANEYKDWRLILVAVILFVCVVAVEIVYALLQLSRRKLQLTKVQKIACGCYLVSFGLLALAAFGCDASVGVTALSTRSVHSLRQSCFKTMWVEVPALAAVALFLGTNLAVFRCEVERIARCRGFVEPVELVKTCDGWIADLHHQSFLSPWLGTINVIATAPVQPSIVITIPPLIPVSQETTPLLSHRNASHLPLSYTENVTNSVFQFQRQQPRQSNLENSNPLELASITVSTQRTSNGSGTTTSPARSRTVDNSNVMYGVI